jgi:hypothetical protein
MAGRYLTQAEAARRARVSKDTIIRARRAGRFPGARLVEHRWMVPAEELAPAGLGPGDAAGEPLEPEASGNAGVDDELTVELAETRAQLAAIRDVVARQDAELRFLRQLLAEAIGRTAG